MGESVVILSAVQSVPPQPLKPRVKSTLLAIGMTLVALMATGFVLWPKSPLDLAVRDHMHSAGLYAQWKTGDVIVLVRHAERCDRSSNPCLGPEDGITQLGNRSAADVGKAFQQVGMNNTDVLSSPTTRTVQTAEAMFGKSAITADWLVSCGAALGQDALAHKAAHRNLVLVTHSGCIDDLEKQLGYRHVPKSEYTSSVFVSVGADGQLKMLGILNAEDWQTALSMKI
ncbi:histidine phosphatase family protein [Pseudomonas asplenii]|uniref:lipopolysaccharide core heptose(II)-phosphate phosphatase PmrG n=1 Tax=Pseudomonas asplenii TaxID=53407 RepID=UPI001E285836|nr:histidine phosphatase family protein [Pseudomonas fuscovaginae]